MHDVSARPERTDSYALVAYDDGGGGWRLFAAAMLTIAGFMNVVHGLAAVGSSDVYARGATFVIADLPTLGWVVAVVGVVQCVAAFAIVGGTRWGRWVGGISAAANSITLALLLPSHPLLWTALFGLHVLVIYALVVHGPEG